VQKFGVGRRLALGRHLAGAADAGGDLRDDLAPGGAVRRGQAGALVGVGDGGEGAADRGRGFSRCGEGGEVDGHEGGRSGQGRGAAAVAPGGKAAPVAVVGAACRGGAAGFDVAACGADLGVADHRGRGLFSVGQRGEREQVHAGASQPRPRLSRDLIADPSF
jgi:hypothetical protein